MKRRPCKTKLFLKLTHFHNWAVSLVKFVRKSTKNSRIFCSFELNMFDMGIQQFFEFVVCLSLDESSTGHLSLTTLHIYISAGNRGNAVSSRFNAVSTFSTFHIVNMNVSIHLLTITPRKRLSKLCYHARYMLLTCFIRVWVSSS